VQVLHGLAQITDPKLLVGAASSDDAAVYALTPELGLVQTVDFFTPVVDDPYLFGQIAATNSLSDVYAMGGRPLTALNIAAMPTDKLDPAAINAILRGGADKVAEAKCVLAGGHTVDAPEPFYGLAVTGLVHPARMITNAAARPGDLLVLTKPLGTGILATALKRGLPVAGPMAAAAALMATLNTPGAEAAEAGLVVAGTDITGFGLLGHLGNLCRGSTVAARLDAARLPAIDPLVLDLIDQGCVPGGSKANLAHASSFTSFADGVAPAARMLAADAQTSGGLLLCVKPADLGRLLDLLDRCRAPCAVVVGEIVPQEPGGPLVIMA
jgi:selenide, water dikinase